MFFVVVEEIKFRWVRKSLFSPRYSPPCISHYQWIRHSTPWLQYTRM